MGLKSLMEYLQKRVPDTPDTSVKTMGYQRKPSIHAGCTPDTPDTFAFGDTYTNTPCKPFGEAANDPDNTESPVLDTPPAPEAEPEAAPPDWRELAQAYHAHHFGCVMCIAAGRGARYGLRCGVGTALWCSYSEAT